MKMKFTPKEVSRICKVAPRTVTKWLDSKRIPSSEDPVSHERHVTRDNLIQFLKQHGMPLGELEDDVKGKVLLVGSDQETSSSITEMFLQDGYEIQTAANGTEAGIKMGLMYPDCLIVDFAIGRNQALTIVQIVREHKEFEHMVRIGLISGEDYSSGIDLTVFNETFRRPFDTSLLCQRIQTLVNSRNEHA